MKVREFSPDGKSVYREIAIGHDRYIGDITSDKTVEIPSWIITHPGISDRALRVWAMLRGHMSGSFEIPGTSHPSLAAIMETSVSSIRRAIEELEEAGAVISQPRFKNGKQTKNAYYLWPAKPGVLTSEAPSERVLTSEQPVHPRTADISININTDIGQNLDTPKQKTSYSDEFERLWEIYPRKVGKNSAFKAFNGAVRRGATYEQLIEAVTEYAKKRVGENDVFTMHASTFFGPDDRWREFTEAGEPEKPMTDVDLVSAKIYDDFDALGVWVNPEDDYEMFDNPAKYGYTRPVNGKGQLVNADGQVYSLDSEGNRQHADYWN